MPGLRVKQKNNANRRLSCRERGLESFLEVLYPLATAGPVLSAPRTSPRRLGVRLSTIQ